MEGILAKLGLTNIFGTLTSALAGLLWLQTTVLHCVPGAADFQAMCTAPSWFPASWVPVTTVVFAGATFIMKCLRPGGLGPSLFGPTAVVVSNDNTKPGTVTPAQVMSTKTVTPAQVMSTKTV